MAHVSVYVGLGELPPFNPDHDGDDPPLPVALLCFSLATGSLRRNLGFGLRALMKSAGVDPAACLVIDDKPVFVAKAIAAGAQGVVLNRSDSRVDRMPSISSLAQLQPLL